DGGQDVVASGHDSAPLLRLPGAQEVGEPRQLLPIVGRELGDLAGQMFDVGAEGDLRDFLAGEEPDRALVEPGQLLQLQGIDLPLAGFHERQGGPRDAEEHGDLVLREAEVLPGLPEPLAQRLPIAVLVGGLGFSCLAHARTFGLPFSTPILLIRSSMSPSASSTLLYPPLRTTRSGGTLKRSRPSRTNTVPTNRFESSNGTHSRRRAEH